VAFIWSESMRKWVIAGVIITAVAGAAYAQSAAIAQRQELFKGMGKASGPLGDMLQGKIPFDAAVAKASFTTISENAAKLKGLFPEDSKEGGKTEALPVIWEKNAEFLAIFDKLKTDADAAAAGLTDQASLGALAGPMFGNCKTCHDSFRVKKS
jgi:cytochrome c556